ncbi:soluble guanylate cyclase 88E [Cimex lectularius]|uniref:guanylate cyclase n=1 Tax=Cimex lectularius TaxID=79782 RepID=A0A8I6TET0_CIMLE|nr:soluble guanylate cyclase 88E [Cimex lectularius]
MYGLILRNFQEFLLECYGKMSWDAIRKESNIEETSFSLYQVYPDNYAERILSFASKILQISENEISEKAGKNLVKFLNKYGYDQVLSVLGRDFRDFLNGLDNLHEYMKFSYPRIRAPSFICENETKHGLILHYRSKRKQFVHYTIGIIKEVGKQYYNKDVHIDIKKEEIVFDVLQVALLLSFNNEEFIKSSHPAKVHERHISVSSLIFFEIFPFSVAFSNDMKIIYAGNSLLELLPNVIGKTLTSTFDIVRPIIQPVFSKILSRANNIFELVTVSPVVNNRSIENKWPLHSSKQTITEPSKHTLMLKGQMIFVEKWEMMVYLGTPVMQNLDYIIGMGLYINDLSMHDFSRDLMIAGTQQSVELKLALEQEEKKTKRIEESINKLDVEMERTNSLLYQMIPEGVAERLRAGESPIDTCQKFESVSILFSDVVRFTEICSRLLPMEVVSMLNSMYSIFDSLTEKHDVQKVETIGDAYMVFSGTKDEEKNHVSRVCDMALDMMEHIKQLKDPSAGLHLRLRIGIHTGPVVAGIVGLKMPRYCLFGRTVKIASQMEALSQPMKIQITQSTFNVLPSEYQATYRGEIRLLDNCVKKTYWLDNKAPLLSCIDRSEELYNQRKNGGETSEEQLNLPVLPKKPDYSKFLQDNYKEKAYFPIVNGGHLNTVHEAECSGTIPPPTRKKSPFKHKKCSLPRNRRQMPNEESDKLIKENSIRTPIGPEPFLRNTEYSTNA